MDAPVPSLELLPSLSAVRGAIYSGTLHLPREREVDPACLFILAPDREDAISAAPGIEAVRETLKLKGKKAAWVYFQRERDFAAIQEESVRRSAIFEMSDSHPAPGHRRSLSSSTLIPPGVSLQTLYGATTADLAAQGYKNLERLMASGELDLGLSTPDIFISPKPLEPTHLLACYDSQPAGGVYFRLIECPVNDLVLLASCPNINVAVENITLEEGGLRTCGAYGHLPHRMDRALPKALLRVPDLEVIAPLVVYLHTRNQAELVRAIIPAEWIRDLLHPLPSAPPEDIFALIEEQDENRSFRIQGSPTKRKGRKLARARSPFRQATNLFMNINTSLTELIAPTSTTSPSHSTVRTADSVAMDIAERCVGESLGVDLAQALQRLGGLRQNLEALGYFERDLWGEVQAMWEMLVKALNCTAVFDARPQGAEGE